MASSGGDLTAGLAFLPRLIANDSPLELTKLLSAWVAASPWTSSTLILPALAEPRMIVRVGADTIEHLDAPPAELSEVAATLTSDTPTTVWQVPSSAGRLYVAIRPAGQPSGLLAVERPSPAWSEADRAYLVLSAYLLERSPALLAHMGNAVDAARLSQRLNDLAVVAGRMAHDFDNILTGIIGFADLTLPDLEIGSQAARFVAEIGQVGQRGTAFTQQLHQFSRSGQTRPQPGSVGAAFTREAARVKAALPAQAQIVPAVPGHLPSVAMDATALQAVIGHLLDNACEALGEAGCIRVDAEVVELARDDSRLYLGQASAGTHLALSIADNGTGIKPEVRAKLFAEPFFTTKVRHRGLGLAIIYRTLCAHRGGIRIDAATPPDSGTIVRVVIPLSTARAVHSPPTTGHLSGDIAHAR